MSHRLIPFSRTGKSVLWLVSRPPTTRRRKNSTEFFYDFFMMGKSIILIVLFGFVECFSDERFWPLGSMIATLSAFKNSWNYRDGKLENFHLENVKIFQFSFLSHREHEPPVRWETDHSKSSIQTGRCWRSVKVAVGKVELEVNFLLRNLRMNFHDGWKNASRSWSRIIFKRKEMIVELLCDFMKQ